MGDGQGVVVQASLALDLVNAHITSVIDGKIYHRIHNSQTTQGAFVTPAETAGQGDPDSVASDLGQVRLVYIQEDTSGGVGREIIESGLSGGTFLDPDNLSLNANDEQSPKVAQDINGIFHAVWSRSGESVSDIVHYTS